MGRKQLVTLCMGLLLAGPAAAIDPGVKCEANKVKEAGKYGFCRAKAESKAIKKGEAADYTKCDSKYSDKWQKAESKAGGACPTEGDQAAIQAQVTADTDTLVARLSGVRFVDNGDGTVTDNQTGLMWEKKVLGSGCLHCVDDLYDWFDAMSDWISEVNGHTDDPDVQAGLGGHTDWRLPTIVELQTILIEPFPCGTNPCIDSIFGPTASSFYWSSSSFAGSPVLAWVVYFFSGSVNVGNKLDSRFVRAVRGP